MYILDYLKENILYLDGSTGTLLQTRGLAPGEYPERWNLSQPKIIQEIHQSYFDAGSHVVCTNTFGANRLKFSSTELSVIIAAAVKNAKAARDASTSPQEKFIALDIGPTGRLLQPFGDLDFEEAVSLFSETIQLGTAHGVDLIFIETMNDSYETKAALLAAKETCDLPIFVSNAYSMDGKLMTGASPAAMVAMLEGMGADAIGVNCSFGPRQLRKVVDELLSLSSIPVLCKPNAGMPRHQNGRTVFDVLPEDFASELANMLRAGLRIAGGCCGTTPAHIRALTTAGADISPLPITDKELAFVSSYTHAVSFGNSPVLIGERINPTGKKRLKQALLDGNMDYILSEGIRQQEAGAHILDVNVGLPEVDEPTLLAESVSALQAVSDLPLQLDTANPVAMEQALRCYNGKAMVNSVSGKIESMTAIFPLVKKYGGLIVALTLDENGIPETAHGRVAIAKHILKTAATYGITKKDLIFDPLAMSVSAEPQAAAVTLETLGLLHRDLGCHTILGISNVSFGLPCREMLNSAFFTASLEQGLSAAILNPFSAEMQKAYHSHLALHGLDENFTRYIDFASHCSPAAIVENKSIPTAVSSTGGNSPLQEAIIHGLKEQACTLVQELLKHKAPLELVEEDIIPALDQVGRGFEAKTIYLPQLLMSAEAAKAAFSPIQDHLSTDNTGSTSRCNIVIATVQGDIHDIGKNIVKLLLENYRFAVTDLGRDVAPEDIVTAVVTQHAPLVGLSALMTTTVPAMEETIRQLRIAAPWCRIIVGGAVLTADYAAQIGADHYAGDAMETVRYAEELDREQIP